MMYKLYTMDDLSFKFYIEDTKRGKQCSRECVERKLLAMMLNASEIIDNGCGCKIYRFGTFNICVREDSDLIGTVYWTQKSTYVSPAQSQILKDLYRLLGLSEDGQTIKKDIDEAGIITYCKEKNLSNTTEYKKGFLDFSHVLD